MGEDLFFGLHQWAENELILSEDFFFTQISWPPVSKILLTLVDVIVQVL